jgi:hypothetical protein
MIQLLSHGSQPPRAVWCAPGAIMGIHSEHLKAKLVGRVKPFKNYVHVFGIGPGPRKRQRQRGLFGWCRFHEKLRKVGRQPLCVRDRQQFRIVLPVSHGRAQQRGRWSTWTAAAPAPTRGDWE